eukprot:m.129844 g.129844  ORF g.129844 m.129844 type:complete len:629 (+) comp16421_c0_seq2:105-1991(+)
MSGGDETPHSLPAVLHFLQREWASFDRERARWTQEQTILQTRVAFLEGQRKAEGSLKRDLLRRIKMLEYALKQEREKNRANGVASSEATSPPPKPFVLQPRPQGDAAATTEGKLRAKEGRDILLQYLSEMGYTDSVIQSQAQRISGLLESWAAPRPAATVAANSGMRSSTSDTHLDKLPVPVGAASSDNKLDADVVAQLAEVEGSFDFLDEEEEAREEQAASASSRKAEVESAEDEELQNRIMKRYARPADKRGRANSKKTKMLEDAFLPPAAAASEQPSAGADDLGDLANLSVGDDADAEADPLLDSARGRKTWKCRHVLKHHMDGVRDVAWTSNEMLLLSASEDHTIKLWEVPTKKTTTEIEPICSYRGHRGGVFCLAVGNGQFFSGGEDSAIYAWDLNSTMERYAPFTNSLAGRMTEHTDAVWSLSYATSSDRLLSSSADGTVKLWNPQTQKCAGTIKTHKIPIRAEFAKADSGKLVVAFTDATMTLYDAQTLEEVRSFTAPETDGEPPGRGFCMTTHGTLPMAVLGDERRHLHFWDYNSGEAVHSMTAHQDAVACVDFDPSGLYLVSGGHDRSIRMWDVSSRQCVDETTAHRVKNDESVHAVRFHPTLPFFVSGSADSTIRVYG